MDATRTLTAADDPSNPPSRAAYVVIALDCMHPLVPPVRLVLDGERVEVGRGARRDWSRRDGVLRIDVPDGWTSTLHARLERVDARWIAEDCGSKNGTLLNGRRIERAELADGDVIEIGNTMLVFRDLTHEGAPSDAVAPAPRSAAPAEALPETLNPSWSHALSTVLRVASSTLAVLLVGQTGTGKEVLARAIHTASARTGPFVPVNCGAIARTLIESELFGVRKGAFSGATEDRPGLVRAADGGTLFLDEIAELPEPSQVALLRVLQEREVLAVGATRAAPVDLRVVAATQEDLTVRLADGRFRPDLYARLCGHVVHLPPLRARIEDVGLLVNAFLPVLAPERADRLKLSRAAGRALLTYAWPFNVRELEQALRSAIAIAPDDEIALSHLPETLRAMHGPPTLPAPPAEARDEERERILAALEACAGNQTRAAKELGISRATLVTKLAIHRIPRPRKPP